MGIAREKESGQLNYSTIIFLKLNTIDLPCSNRVQFYTPVSS